MDDMKNRKPFKIQLGDWTVWSLSDGHINLDQRILFDKDLAVLRKELHQTNPFCIDDFFVSTQINTYLIKTNEQLILVDAGYGDLHRPEAGFLLSQLRKLEFSPSDITHVLITHLHPDHTAGLIDTEEKRVFPKAILCAPSIDTDFWTNDSNKSKVKDILHPNFNLSKKVIELYQSNKMLRLIQEKEILLPGIEAVKASGHTPGHTAYLFQSLNKSLLLWGDIVHNINLQLKNPDWEVVIDTDPQQGITSREYLLKDVSRQHVLVGGGHLPNTGLGYISQIDEHFTWNALSDTR